MNARSPSTDFRLVRRDQLRPERIRDNGKLPEPAASGEASHHAYQDDLDLQCHEGDSRLRVRWRH